MKEIILWAVDPFCEDKSALRSTAWAIRALVKSKPCSVQPVYIWRSAPFDIADDLLIQEVQAEAQDELKGALSRIQIPGVLPLKAFMAGQTSAQEAVQKLISLAKELNSEMIVISTHARKGVGKFFHGGFTETLTLYSDVPVLTVNPNWRRTLEFKKILFPTDFSDESKKAFEKIVDFASTRKSQIVLFYKPGMPGILPYDAVFMASIPDYQQLYEDELKMYESESQELVKLAKAQDVPVQVIFESYRGGSVADAVLKAAQRMNCMVAMASRSNRMSTLLLGSTTRQVVRGCEQPVWVIHPTAQVIQKKESLDPMPLFTVTEKERERPFHESNVI